MNYILNDQHETIEEPDIITWAQWFETADRKVAKDSVCGADVSTVFLGIDHAFGGGTPLLFETMVFSSDESIDGETWRYTTWADAERGHKEACDWVREQ